MHFVVSSAHLHCTNYTAWFARVFFPIVFDLCEEGSIRLKLLPVCCWPCHVMSIMGSPSCFEPELVASDVFCICLFMAALALVSSQCCEFLLLCMVVSTASSFLTGIVRSTYCHLVLCSVILGTLFPGWLLVPLRSSSSFHHSPRLVKKSAQS